MDCYFFPPSDHNKSLYPLVLLNQYILKNTDGHMDEF